MCAKRVEDRKDVLRSKLEPAHYKLFTSIVEASAVKTPKGSETLDIEKIGKIKLSWESAWTKDYMQIHYEISMVDEDGAVILGESMRSY